jgi:hypothetical protein
MKNYFYRLNNSFLKTFKANVIDRYSNENIRTDISFLRSILTEVTTLFRKIGGMVSNKNKIPKKGEYPDSKTFNQLLEGFDVDITKLFSAQKLVEDDINHLLMFNSAKRSEILEELNKTQQATLSTYIKNKKDLNNETKITISFNSDLMMSNESQGVAIDTIRGILTLNSTSSLVKPIDVNNVMISFCDNMVDSSYPGMQFLAIGSHWKRDGNDQHFLNFENKDIENDYRTRMIDDSNSNTGVGWCEFEAVNFGFTGYQYGQPVEIYPYVFKKYIGEHFGKSPNQIFLDYNNSFQGFPAKMTSDFENKYKFRILIPFTEKIKTNQIQINFRSNEESGDIGGGKLPKIVWGESKVWSGLNSINLIPPNKTSDNEANDGKYICSFEGSIRNGFVSPDKIELIVEYNSDPWQCMPFYMVNYSYSSTNSYKLNSPSAGSSAINFIYGKTFNIFVDVQANREKEQEAARNVLKDLSKSITV